MNKSRTLESARALFPKSANKTIMVRAAWHPDRSTLDRPAPGGMDGWDSVNREATYPVLVGLKAAGYTVINLEAHGVADGLLDVGIDRLI